MCVNALNHRSSAKWLLSCLKIRWLKRLPELSWATQVCSPLITIVKQSSQFTGEEAGRTPLSLANDAVLFKVP